MLNNKIEKKKWPKSTRINMSNPWHGLWGHDNFTESKLKKLQCSILNNLNVEW
jgi:hypothetical protein